MSAMKAWAEEISEIIGDGGEITERVADFAFVLDLEGPMDRMVEIYRWKHPEADLQQTRDIFLKLGLRKMLKRPKKKIKTNSILVGDDD